MARTWDEITGDLFGPLIKRTLKIMDEKKMVTFDRETLKRFKKAYKRCAEDSFEFQGNTYLKSYAKYLIEFLDNKFKTEGA